MANPARPSILQSPWLAFLFDLVLVVAILAGLVFRFAWVNWNSDAQLHPDEYGLTNTLTVLRIPDTLSDYFNTRLSPISPYQKYDFDGLPAEGGPDNRMRWGQWPMIIIRAAAEMNNDTGYGELRILGRRLSALSDFLAVILLYFTGRRLYGHHVGLLGAAFSALAVMQIQQSHFMTVDNFGTFFSAAALYCCVRIAQLPLAARFISSNQGSEIPVKSPPYQPEWRVAGWFALFGVSFGMALACKVNLLPLAGMILPAAFISIADLKLRRRDDLTRIAIITAGLLLLAGLVSVITFRVTQPMSFRALSGDTTLLTFNLNPDWVDSMEVASMESRGVGGGPPGEQWAARPAILFPLMNLVVWGLGLPLGLAAWAGFARAGWQTLRKGTNWQAHLLPLIWTGGYFLFMGTRWVKSIRYFLPIYPFLCLLAAWLLIELWRSARASSQRRILNTILAGLTFALVLAGTFTYARVFTAAVYEQDHTRIRATEWIYQNVPAPVHLELDTAQGLRFQPVGAPDGLPLEPGQRYTFRFSAQNSGKVIRLIVPRIRNPTSTDASVEAILGLTEEEGLELEHVTLIAPPSATTTSATPLIASLDGAKIESGKTYYLTLVNHAQYPLTLNRLVISNENWDEGLPVPYHSYSPFGDFYRGVTMEVRWYDDENKRRMFYERLAQVDYIILPSQRGIWSTARLQLTYPMTIEYYRALFDGRLGFDLVAQFDAPFKIGPLWISDVGGTLGWKQPPELPVFNFNFFAAEEAFSVYDHPPVWIFKKRADFNLQNAVEILDSFDLSTVIVQSPRDARPRPIQ
jgi:hypothetical protein